MAKRLPRSGRGGPFGHTESLKKAARESDAGQPWLL